MVQRRPSPSRQHPQPWRHLSRRLRLLSRRHQRGLTRGLPSAQHRTGKRRHPARSHQPSPPSSARRSSNAQKLPSRRLPNSKRHQPLPSLPSSGGQERGAARASGRAHRVAAALETGIVWVNSWLVRDLRTPFGGMKASGIGREGGMEALHFFTEAKNVYIQL